MDCDNTGFAENQSTMQQQLPCTRYWARLSIDDFDGVVLHRAYPATVVLLHQASSVLMHVQYCTGM